VVKLCTKLERNRAIGGGVILILDLMTFNLCHVLRLALRANFHHVLARSSYLLLIYSVILLQIRRDL